MATKLKPRQRQILSALRELGGRASQREIAEKTGLNTNGVSQTLSAMGGVYVRPVGDDRRNRVWEIIDPPAYVK